MMSITSLIHTPTNGIEKSIDFYKQLGFQKIVHPSMQLLGDSQCVVEINPDRFARAGVKLFKESWQIEIDQLKKIAPVKKVDNNYLVVDPSNVFIYLIEGDSGIQSLGNAPSVLGNFAGLSLESGNMELSVNIWSSLGFEKSMGSIEQGWITYQRQDGFGVSLMQTMTCPHLFFNPSLTYFNAKQNLEIIDQIRQKNIPIAEEITQFNKEGIVDNIIIRDPGGYGFFIFND